MTNCLNYEILFFLIVGIALISYTSIVEYRYQRNLRIDKDLK